MAILKKIALVILTLIIASPCAKADHQPSHPFTVGMILPLTGGLADFGEALRHGFELAAADYPEQFKYISLNYEDSKYDEKTSLSAFYSLEQKGGINLYHVWGVSPNAAILPVSNAKKRPVIVETSMMSAGRNRPYVVIASRTGSAASELLINAFIKKGWKHVGVIVTQIPYYTDIAEALAEFGKRSGITVETIGQVDPAEHDFKSMVLRSKNGSFDAVGPLLLGDQISTFCTQAKTLHFSKPIFGAHIHNSLDLMSQCLPFSEGALIPGVIVSKEFRDRYVARYKNDLRIDSAAGSYETAKIIGELFGNATSASLSAEEIMERFKSVDHPESTIGGFRYSESEQGGKAIRFSEKALTFKNGAIVPF